VPASEGGGLNFLSTSFVVSLEDAGPTTGSGSFRSSLDLFEGDEAGFADVVSLVVERESG
jgi:hypothetical protein